MPSTRGPFAALARLFEKGWTAHVRRSWRGASLWSRLTQNLVYPPRAKGRATACAPVYPRSEGVGRGNGPQWFEALLSQPM